VPTDRTPPDAAMTARNQNVPEAHAPGARAKAPGGQRGADPAAAAESNVNTLLRSLAREVGEDHFERYFLGQTRLLLDGGVLVVTVASGFLSQLIERRFSDALRRVTGASVVRFNVDRSVFTPRELREPRTGEASPGRPAMPAPAKYGLDDFIVGSANRLAYAAVRRLVEGDTPGAPTFIHGACGLGKTHLLQGAVSLFQRLHPRGQVRYVTGEQFTNDFLAALKGNRVDGFRKQYRSCELLCVDDVHFLSNKDATQSELLHTFDAAGLGGARILIASDEHPREIAKMSERLLSRFLSGAVAKLETPDPALRRQLVAHMARRRGLALCDEAADLLCQRSARAIGTLGGFGGSVREIEGLVNQVDAVWRLLGGAEESGGAVSAGAVRRALGLEEQRASSLARPGSLASHPRRPIPVQTIVDHVCRTLGVDMSEFGGAGRHKRVVLARALAAHLARLLTTQSFPEIARAMGRTNHSTVITAQRRLQRQLEETPDETVSNIIGMDVGGVGLLTLSALIGRLAGDVRSQQR